MSGTPTRYGPKLEGLLQDLNNHAQGAYDNALLLFTAIGGLQRIAEAGDDDDAAFPALTVEDYMTGINHGVNNLNLELLLVLELAARFRCIHLGIGAEAEIEPAAGAAQASEASDVRPSLSEQETTE